MDLQAAHLENGVWTTRHVGVSELLARNRARRKGQSQEVNVSMPKVGLLSQTVIPSPTIQCVLPARLRSNSRSDVIFVGQRSIQLREVVRGLYLEDVIIKSDFNANITAAKVINTCPELSWEAQMRLGANASTPQSLKDDNPLPSQILVLTLESRELVFLYYNLDTSSSEGGHFVHFRRPLPSDVSILERFGRHIAVDPRSRAIAVAAPADYFGIFLLKSSEDLKSQISEGKLSPIAEERFFHVDGDILFVEFLYPNLGDNRMILLLVVAKDQNTYAVCYDWDASTTLRYARPRVTLKPLPAEDRLPSILIPLTKATSFMLATSASMAVYRNVLDTGLERAPTRYPISSPKKGPSRSPLWIHWARPFRNWVYNQSHDEIYLCREDGLLSYLEIDNAAHIEHQTTLGQLDCDVDAAFEVLDIDFVGGDFLIVAGNMGDGALFVQEARKHPKCLQKFLNWAPVLDSVVVNSSLRPASRQIEETSELTDANETVGDRVFICSGPTTGRGAVVQLRHGIEARIGLVIPLEDLSGPRYIWAMPDNLNGGIYLLVSDPISSTLLYLPTDSVEEIYVVDDSKFALNFSAQTLAAGCTPSRVIIQVTHSSVHLATSYEPIESFCFNFEAHQAVLVATIDHQRALVAMAVRIDHETYIHLGRVLSSDGSLRMEIIGCPAPLDYEPTCLSLQDSELGVLLIVGTTDGRLSIHLVKDDGISFLISHHIHANGETVSKAIESIASVTTKNQETSLKRRTLFCGLRSGNLVLFDMYLDREEGPLSIGLRQGALHKLGETAVILRGDLTREDFVLVSCGNRFWYLTHIRDGGPLDYTLRNIWVTDQKNSSYFQKTIDVFTLIDPLPDTGYDSLSGSLVYASEGQLLICTLDRHANTVPQRICLPGSANRMIYSKQLKSLVVAYATVEMDMQAHSIKRYIRPHLEFIDPNVQQPQVLSPVIPAEGQLWRPCGAAGERITCILDWTPRRDGEEYHFIVIGTSRQNQLENGRVIFLQAQRDPANPEQIECSVKHIHRFEGPVRSIAAYGDFTLMVATGYGVVPLEPKFSERKWVRGARFMLSSPVISITVSEPYLYLATARESLIVLKVVDEKLVLYAHDSVKREGLSHCYIGGEAKLTLVSSRGGTISVLTEIGITEDDKLLSPALAEAHLPSSVIRLNPSCVRPRLSSSSVVYGTTIDGSVYRFMTLSEGDWRLLKFLQNLCTRDSALCPFSSGRKKQWAAAEIEPASGKPSNMHIDGDILVRLLKRGSRYLREILAHQHPHFSEASQPPEESDTEQLAKTAREVLGQCSDPVEDVIKWLRDVLQF